MANRYRGEIAARLDGKPYTLCLTLGALAELESAFADPDMLALATRFESGRLKAHDCVRILGAGLRGAGHAITDEEVARMRCEDGAAGFVGIVANLLQATFEPGERPAPNHHVAPNASAEVDASPRPFPGTR
jgi:hypothetical protein